MTRREGDHQLPLALGGDASNVVVPVSRRANRKRGIRIAAQQARDGKERRFLPIAGVPATRGDCPTERPCAHISCRWHLWRVDAENRAGRPGLAHVPRDEGGRTRALAGDVGGERPGTTLIPEWLELQRHCKASIEIDATGRICALSIERDHLPRSIDEGSQSNAEEVWAGMRLHEGEQLRVVSEDGTWATRATWRQGAVVLERAPLVGQVCAVLITRVRGVPSCGLDLIEQHGKMGNQAIGDAIGRHRTLVAEEIKQALRKAVEEGERQGVAAEDLVATLMRMGEGKS